MEAAMQNNMKTWRNFGATVGIFIGAFLNLPAFAQDRCTLVGPEFLLEMNTVVAKANVPVGGTTVVDVAKTVNVEKEIFFCDPNGDGVVDIIRDVQIFTEIIEKMTDFSIVSKGFEVITCEKTPAGDVLGCRSETPPPLGNNGCGPTHQEPRRPPRDPIEMNTVAKGKKVKTIKAQKEIFDCPVNPFGIPTLIKEVQTFTEILEDLGAGTVRKRVEVAECKKDSDTGKVVGCKFLPPFVLQ